MAKDKYILFHCPGTTDQSFFDANSRDNCCEPFITLKKRCAELGYILEVTKNQDLDACRWIVFWDVTSMGPAALDQANSNDIEKPIAGNGTRDIYAEAIARGFNDRLTLMLSEPVSVCAQNGNISAHNKCKHVFTWDRSLVDGEKYIHTYLPVTAVYPELPIIPFKDKLMLVDISGNKASSHPRELYTERRDTIRFFDRHFSADFDLYGIGWNTYLDTSLWNRSSSRYLSYNFYQTYRGTVQHKWDILPKYKFNICYENINEERDYVSQRIFDVLRCGCVPIYLGAPNIEEYVDKDAFLDRRAFASNEELAKYIATISEKEYNRFLEAGRDYLASEKFKLFLSPNYVNTIVDALSLEST
jgi:alpha(1,3/1,4) fucosyltransferase